VDSSEAIVAKYLSAQGFTDVVHHPDGRNNPPDFLVGGRIAVEVRRLNQHETTGQGPRGLEHGVAGVSSVLREVLACLGSPGPGPTWFVIPEYSRPLPTWKTLKKAVRAALLDFESLADSPSSHIEVAPHFRLHLLRSSQSGPQRFVLGGLSDHDLGGAVLHEAHRNLLICIDDKRRKVARVQAKYPVWWLALVDYIGHGLHPREREQLRALVTVERPWDSIVLVNPTDPASGFAMSRAGASDA